MEFQGTAFSGTNVIDGKPLMCPVCGQWQRRRLEVPENQDKVVELCDDCLAGDDINGLLMLRNSMREDVPRYIVDKVEAALSLEV